MSYLKETVVARTKLRARKLIHRRISHLGDLRQIYTISDVIGKGNFGTVVRAKNKETEVCWAIKAINKRQAGASRVLSVEREIYILKLVKHPNIIYLDCVFESPKAIYLVFELCIESLAKMFRAKKQFQESETINVIRSLSCALAYLHKNDIVHRDLKLENILTADNPDDAEDQLFIKVSDFGLSAMRIGPGHDNMLHDFCGTLAYMAPEMIATKSYSQQCDVWSMGIIMYLLLFGKFPFISGNNQQLCRLINKADIDFSGLSCSLEARNLLSKLLDKNPAFRLTAAEVKNHPWISGVENSVQTETRNVLDMMRLWRDEMLESTRDDVNSRRVSLIKQQVMQNSDNEDKGRTEPITKLNTSTSDNAMSNETLSDQSFVFNSKNHEISKSKTQTLRQSGDKGQTEWITQWDASTSSDNSIISNETLSNLSSVINSKNHEISESKIQTTRQSGDNKGGTERSMKLNTSTSDNAIANETVNKLSPVINNENREISESQSHMTRQSAANKRHERAPSRLPDFSHVQAKVDSNLANLRKESQKKRDGTRKLIG